MEKYIYAAVGAGIGFFIALIIYLIQRNSAFRTIAHSKSIAEEIKSNAKTDAENAKKAALIEARDEWFKQKRTMEEEVIVRQLFEKEYSLWDKDSLESLAK